MVDLGVVGGMATMPTRAAYAERAVASVLRNVDQLFLFLDRFECVPDYARNHRIVILRSQEFGDLRANGKLLGLTLAKNADYYMCCDDDMEYPKGFSRRLVRACRRYSSRVVAGIYGSTFKHPINSYVRDRNILTTRKRLYFGKRVDVLGTNGCLHAIAAMKFDVRDWTRVNMVDLHFAFEAQKAGLDLHVVAHKAKWVGQIERHQEDSIYLRLRENDSEQTRLVNQLLKDS